MIALYALLAVLPDMSFLPRILIAMALLTLASPGAALADVQGLTVADVPAEATAASASEARDIALATGQRDALTQLLQRLTAAADQPRLPLVTDDMVVSTVQVFEVQSERRSATRYVARLKVTFRRDPVLAILAKADVAFTRPSERPIVLLPIWRGAAGALLWEESNPWHAAWAARDAGADLVPILVPAGDLQDLRTIQTAQAQAGDPPALTAIAQRYDADTIIVAEAAPAPGVQALDVTLRRAGPSGVSTTTERVDLDPAITDPALQLAAAANEIARRLESGTRDASLVPSGAPGSVAAFIQFGGLPDWLAVRQRLRAVSAITRLEVLSLSTGDARVILHYQGDPLALAGALAAQGLELQRTADGVNVFLAAVMPAGGVTTPTPSPAPSPVGVP